MGIRTGAQYNSALKSRQPEIWLEGRKATNAFEEKVFQQPILEIAKLYDMQHDPAYQEKITHICEETGERISNAFLIPKSYEDLVARREVFETFCKSYLWADGKNTGFLKFCSHFFIS